MDLSVIVPARNEEFLQKTIDSVLDNARAETEVIAILDGYWPDIGIPDRKNLKIIHNSVPMGQRQATNQGAMLSEAKYIMKADAHCAFDEGFDVKLMKDCQSNWIVLPRMFTLDAFHWVCKSCQKEYGQGPQKDSCEACVGVDFEKKVVFLPKKRRMTDYMWFDTTLTVKYFDSIGLGPYGENPNELKKLYSHSLRDWAKGDITDVMCGVGACWFLDRGYYWDIGGLDENHGSWGQMGVEIAMKAWLSGGRHVVNKTTWFAHLFRTQTGFSWPYENKGSDQQVAREYSRDLWLNDKWSGRKKNLDYVIDKFNPLPGWDKLKGDYAQKKTVTRVNPTTLSKGIIYYSDNRVEDRIANVVRSTLLKTCSEMDIVSVTLYPVNFGRNIVWPGDRGIITMFEQIYEALKAVKSDIVFFCEHDIIYHPSHFTFTPMNSEVYYYNENTWKVCAKTGQALFYYTKQVSGLCGYRELLTEHYAKRIERVKKDGFTRGMGYEPGCHAYPRGVDSYKAERYMSDFPNVDIRHGANLTENRFNKEQFRSEKSIIGWTESDSVPGWGTSKGRFDQFLKDISLRNNLWDAH